MGKRLIQQRRGRGSATYIAPSHRYLGKIAYPNITGMLKGEILDIVNCRGHSAPLMFVEFEDQQVSLLPAPLGAKVGQQIVAGDKAPINVGNITQLKNIPSGTFVCNVERKPFDRGKLIRSAGGSAQIISSDSNKVILKMPSKKSATFNPNCFATIGAVAGAGKNSKPFTKAGCKYHAMRARNKLYPRVHGVAMNVIDHPHGGTHRRTLGKPTSRKRGLSPGKKVGSIAAKRTGKSKK